MILIAEHGAEFDVDPVGLDDFAAHADFALKTFGHRLITKMQPPGEALGIAQDRSARSRLDRTGYGVGRAAGREVHFKRSIRVVGIGRSMICGAEGP